MKFIERLTKAFNGEALSEEKPAKLAFAAVDATPPVPHWNEIVTFDPNNPGHMRLAANLKTMARQAGIMFGYSDIHKPHERETTESLEWRGERFIIEVHDTDGKDSTDDAYETFRTKVFYDGVRVFEFEDIMYEMARGTITERKQKCGCLVPGNWIDDLADKTDPKTLWSRLGEFDSSNSEHRAIAGGVMEAAGMIASTLGKPTQGPPSLDTRTYQDDKIRILLSRVPDSGEPMAMTVYDLSGEPIMGSIGTSEGFEVTNVEFGPWIVHTKRTYIALARRYS